MKIVSVIKPFVMQQNIFVYENGNKIDSIKSTIDDIQDIIIDIATKYETNSVELIGAKSYLEGIKNRIETAEMTKYNEHKLNIQIIGA